MSDDISIPREPMQASGPATFTRSYRTRRAGMDTTTKRMLLGAGALALALVGGMGVWALGGHRSAGVPTIEADTSPLRVKPDNPGGMSVIGFPEAGAGSSGGTGDLAPAAERPDPQALLAQRQIGPTPTPAPTSAPSPTLAPTSTATPAPVAAASPDPAAAKPAASVAARPAAAPAASSPATPGPAVQLAALDSQSAASAEWTRLQKKAPELLGERHPLVERATVEGKTVWRVRMAGFSDLAEATGFCRKARAKGLACSLATF